MQNLFAMEVVYPQTNLNEVFPDYVLIKERMVGELFMLEVGL